MIKKLLLSYVVSKLPLSRIIALIVSKLLPLALKTETGTAFFHELQIGIDRSGACLTLLAKALEDEKITAEEVKQIRKSLIKLAGKRRSNNDAA